MVLAATRLLAVEVVAGDQIMDIYWRYGEQDFLED